MNISKVIVIFILLLGTLPVNGQNSQEQKNDSLVMEYFICQNDSIELILPRGWIKSNTDNYTEGFIWSIIYPDTSFISVLCGSNAELNPSTDHPEDLNNRKITMGRLQIIYDRVKDDRLNLFDMAFDEMEKQ